MGGHATVKNLEAELKLLRWHKLANESALKAAILKDKQIKSNDRVPQLLHDSKLRLNKVIEDERSKDLITDEAFVKKQQEYARMDEEAARRKALIESKRLRCIQMKANNIQLSQTRKQKCLQIEMGAARRDVECITADEQTNSVRNDASQTLVRFKSNEIESQSQSPENERAMLKRSQSCPPGAITSFLRSPSVETLNSFKQRSNAAVAGEQRTKLNFTRLQSKSGPGEPSRPYYCVRVSRSRKL